MVLCKGLARNTIALSLICIHKEYSKVCKVWLIMELHLAMSNKQSICSLSSSYKQLSPCGIINYLIPCPSSIMGILWEERWLNYLLTVLGTWHLMLDNVYWMNEWVSEWIAPITNRLYSILKTQILPLLVVLFSIPCNFKIENFLDYCIRIHYKMPLKWYLSLKWFLEYGSSSMNC